MLDGAYDFNSVGTRMVIPNFSSRSVSTVEGISEDLMELLDGISIRNFHERPGEADTEILKKRFEIVYEGHVIGCIRYDFIEDNSGDPACEIEHFVTAGFNGEPTTEQEIESFEYLRGYLSQEFIDAYDYKGLGTVLFFNFIKFLRKYGIKKVIVKNPLECAVGFYDKVGKRARNAGLILIHSRASNKDWYYTVKRQLS